MQKQVQNTAEKIMFYHFSQVLVSGKAFVSVSVPGVWQDCRKCSGCPFFIQTIKLHQVLFPAHILLDETYVYSACPT